MLTLVLPFPAIDPVALSLGPVDIRWYALAYIAGIMLGWRHAIRLSRSETVWGGPSPVGERDLDDFLLWATAGIILGGRLGYVLFYNPGYYLENPVEALMVWRGGMAFHGGFLGVLLAIALFARLRKIPVLSLSDLVCAVVPIGLFFGRIANFINGELFGRPSDVAWAMVFPGGGPLPRHPSQLYQAGLEGILLFLVLAVLIYRFGTLRRPGLVTGVFVAGYGLARVFSELFRQPDAHIGFLAGGLTMGITLSVPMVLAGLAVTLWAAKRTPA
ncbi:MAG: prolipoprotein diacylglyceryl transferase [Pseudomonadota bacterium]